MAKSAKIKTRKPISTVTLLAWGLLALATAFDHIPSFRAAALILYAVDWLALAIAATLTKRKQTLIIRPGMILPLFISTLLLFQRKIRMDHAACGDDLACHGVLHAADVADAACGGEASAGRARGR